MRTKVHYSKEEKKEYFRKLREQWKDAKKLAETDQIKAIYSQVDLKQDISITSFSMVYKQMQAQGLDGLPYVDMKTYKGWKDNGFQVIKGEHSTANAITWIKPGQDEDEDEEEDNKDTYVFPKVYNLYHRSQVEEI